MGLSTRLGQLFRRSALAMPFVAGPLAAQEAQPNPLTKAQVHVIADRINAPNPLDSYALTTLVPLSHGAIGFNTNGYITALGAKRKRIDSHTFGAKIDPTKSTTLQLWANHNTMLSDGPNGVGYLTPSSNAFEAKLTQDLPSAQVKLGNMTVPLKLKAMVGGYADSTQGYHAGIVQNFLGDAGFGVHHRFQGENRTRANIWMSKPVSDARKAFLNVSSNSKDISVVTGTPSEKGWATEGLYFQDLKSGFKSARATFMRESSPDFYAQNFVNAYFYDFIAQNAGGPQAINEAIRAGNPMRYIPVPLGQMMTKGYALQGSHNRFSNGNSSEIRAAAFLPESPVYVSGGLQRGSGGYKGSELALGVSTRTLKAELSRRNGSGDPAYTLRFRLAPR